MPHDACLFTASITPSAWLLFSTHTHSLAISSDNKELYAGYSNQQIAAWVKLKHDIAGAHTQEGEFEHLNLDNYYNQSKFVR